MTQITQGIRSLLSSPIVYSHVQSLMGAKRLRKYFVDEYIRPFPRLRVLDIGCGPGDLLGSLSDVVYWGFDISQPYINHAKLKYGDKGIFICKHLTTDDLGLLPEFDVVIASGLLHHMDDDVAVQCLKLAHQALKPSGRLVTIDPCWQAGQNAIAKFLIHLDRGQNVRNESQYKSLASTVFSVPRVTVRHSTWIPYTHCYMECTKHDPI